MPRPRSGRIAASRAGAGWVLHRDPVEPPLLGILERLPAEPGRIGILVAPGVEVTEPFVADTIAELLPEHGYATEVRLLVSWSGGTQTSPTPAQHLADRIRAGVVAPTGVLYLVPDGSLFVNGPDAGWRRFAPAAAPDDLGRRFPMPHWEPELRAALPETPGGDLRVDEVPAGLWVRPACAPPAGDDDPVLASPAAADRVAVLVGAPGHRRLTDADLALVYLAAGPALRRRLVLVDNHGAGPDCPDCSPSEPESTGQSALGALLAARLRQPVHTFGGIPVAGPAGGVDQVRMDAGEPTWRPFARLLEHRPGHDAPVVHEARPPVAGWSPDATTWPLVTGWVVEAVQAGLWIRPDDETAAAAQVRAVPTDPKAPLVVVGAPGETVPRVLWAAVAHLLQRLPEDARDRAVVALTGGATPVGSALAGRTVRNLG